MHDAKLSAIDLNLLVVLEALLDERHVTRAAAKLGLSQSATSHALNRLRALYDDPLLVRTGSRLTLTPRALTLRHAVTRGLAELSSTITGEPAFEPRTTRRTFHVSGHDYGLTVLMPGLLSFIEREAPGIDLSIMHVPRPFELMEQGQIDLALTISTQIPSGFPMRKLFDDGFVCMVRKRHPQLRGKLTLSQFVSLQHVLVDMTNEPGSIVDTELDKRGKRRRVALRVPSFLVVPQLVAESNFITTFPERLARKLATVYPVRLLPPPLPLPGFEFALAWHARLDHDPAHIWLREALARIAADL